MVAVEFEGACAGAVSLARHAGEVHGVVLALIVWGWRRGGAAGVVSRLA